MVRKERPAEASMSTMRLPPRDLDAWIRYVEAPAAPVAREVRAWAFGHHRVPEPSTEPVMRKRSSPLDPVSPIGELPVTPRPSGHGPRYEHEGEAHRKTCGDVEGQV